MAEKPVTLRPGRARLSAKPLATGSPIVMATIGIVAVARRAALVAGVAGGDDDLHLRLDQLAREQRQAFELALGEAPLDRQVAALGVAQLAQLADERRVLRARLGLGQRRRRKHADAAHAVGCCACAIAAAQARTRKRILFMAPPSFR